MTQLNSAFLDIKPLPDKPENKDNKAKQVQNASQSKSVNFNQNNSSLNAQTSFTLKVNVAHIMYSNKDTFFTVFMGTILDQGTYVGQLPEQIKCTGTIRNLSVGDKIEVTGTLSNTAKYGLSFDFGTNFKQVMPSSKQELINFMVKHVKGVGQAYAIKIYNALGMNAIPLIQKDYHVLVKKLGFNDKRAQDIANQLAQPAQFNKLVLFLQSMGLPTNKLAEQIYQDLGQDSVAKIRYDPYILTDYRGLSFRQADQVAKKLGVSPRRSGRFASAIQNYLNRALANGNMAVKGDQLAHDLADSTNWMNLNSAYYNADKFNSLSRKQLQAVYNEMKRENMVTDIPYQTGTQVPDTDKASTHLVYTADSYNVETHILQEIFKRVHMPIMRFNQQRIDQLLDNYQTLRGITLAQGQIQAVNAMLNHPVVNVTGGAGFGKTTLVDAFIYVYTKLVPQLTDNEVDKRRTELSDKIGFDPKDIIYKQIALVSPTGKAAHNLMEDTRYPATTVHKLLGMMPGAKRGNKYLIGDYLIIDESSMLDANIVSAILYNIGSNVRLVFIGDPNQLPSVGPGTVFKDLIDSGVVPTVKLTKVFRQSASSIIYHNDLAILDGLTSTDKNGVQFTDDLTKSNVFVPAADSKAISDKLQAVLDNLINKQGYDLNDIMILTPIHKGEAGTITQNLRLQQHLNKYAKHDIDMYEQQIDTIRKQATKNGVQINPQMQNTVLSTAQIQGNSLKDLALKSSLSTHELAVQLAMNHALDRTNDKVFLSSHGRAYYVGDRMLQLQNDYSDKDNEVMNGSIGTITDILYDGKSTKVPAGQNQQGKNMRGNKIGFKVRFEADDAEKEYKTISDLQQIDLGYTYTVHKAQGSGSPVVICLIDKTAFNMLDRTLIYTAATRAKEKMIFIGQQWLFDKAIKEIKQEARVSGLCMRLQEAETKRQAGQAGNVEDLVGNTIETTRQSTRVEQLNKHFAHATGQDEQDGNKRKQSKHMQNTQNKQKSA